MSGTTVREADVRDSRRLNQRWRLAHARAARINTRPHCLLIVALAATLFSLVPLASATPVDQSWILGLYDKGNYDDIVLAITDATGLHATSSSDDSSREPSHRLVTAPRSTPTLEPSRIRLVGRAPPLS